MAALSSQPMTGRDGWQQSSRPSRRWSSTTILDYQQIIQGPYFIKVHADTEEKKFDLIKDPLWLPSASELPSLVEPRGLPPDRQWYLYEHIREFCPDYSKDTVAPLPTIPKPSTRKSPPPSSPSVSNSKKAPPSAPVSKRKKAPSSAPSVPKRRKT